MVVKVKEKFEKTKRVKSKTYILRGQRNVRYYERILRSFLKSTISFSFVSARTFDRAGTFTRTFDRDFVRGEYNDLKFCGRIFYYAAGKK